MWQHQLLKAHPVLWTQLAQTSPLLADNNRIATGFIPSVAAEKKGRRGNKEHEPAVYLAEACFMRGAGLMTLSPAPPRNTTPAQEKRLGRGGRNDRRKEER
jgi:hypothetical protein